MVACLNGVQWENSNTYSKAYVLRQAIQDLIRESRLHKNGCMYGQEIQKERGEWNSKIQQIRTGIT